MSCPPRRPVHPHRRGDGDLLRWRRRGLAGSPPQAWGRQDRDIQLGVRSRFTPTGVGTAAPASGSGSATTVHPHRRGDGAPAAERVTSKYGSPPQAWGRLISVLTRSINLRFTPTGVGTATGQVIKGAAGGGSPPQAWGRQQHGEAHQPEPRFTPTGVGTAGGHHRRRPRHPVHPHRRGDGFCPVTAPSPRSGSPPQAWGRRRGRVAVFFDPRFTPTGVGTAPRSSTSAS